MCRVTPIMVAVQLVVAGEKRVVVDDILQQVYEQLLAVDDK